MLSRIGLNFVHTEYVLPLQIAKKRKIRTTVTLRHDESSTVSRVGLQVWTGAFLMSDYLISQADMIRDKVVVELGAGCGFVGVILTLLDHRGAYCTDYCLDILDLCSGNIERNLHVDSPLAVEGRKSAVKVKVLDWCDLNSALPCSHDDKSDYGWSDSDLAAAGHGSRLFIAADVVYDDILTEALFRKLSQLMKRGDTLVLSIEKRFNFSASEQSVAATGYGLFLDIVLDRPDRAVRVSKFVKRFKGRCVPLDSIPQVVEDYDRSDLLELWEIELRE